MYKISPSFVNEKIYTVLYWFSATVFRLSASLPKIYLILSLLFGAFSLNLLC
jgi:hypothetical protein